MEAKKNAFKISIILLCACTNECTQVQIIHSSEILGNLNESEPTNKRLNHMGTISVRLALVLKMVLFE